MNQRPDAEELFKAVVSLDGEAQRAYLDAHCEDPEVRAEVDKLLAYDLAEGGGLTNDVHAVTDSRPVITQSRPGRGHRLPADSASSSSIDHGRFLPGTVLSDRYRVVGLLGKGGMGEVYRADDLELGQSVALKFLPEQVSNDPRALERFRGEVRLARQVSHPNVCRVYDIGQVDGQWFLSMEYVDGEDLAQLLRRIGRFPADRATEIARQLCLGLHAAHEKGVLHRDLKPANIMIDGRGKLLITDFGLAEIAGDVHQGDIRSGTPAYMSPEQLAGREVTTRSDIYALGLILHEIYTGKPVWQADNMAKLIAQRSNETPPTPSNHVDLDPLVEAVIQRCLEPSPEKRPSTVIRIVASLPGGDPLQAALAAGETPSPKMVAEAGETTRFGMRPALACLVGVLLLLPLNFWLNDFVSNLGPSSLLHEPAVLADEAREILANDLGFDVGGGSIAYGIDKDWSRADGIEDQLFHFWYRQRPEGRELFSEHYWSSNWGQESYARPDYFKPSKDMPGELSMILGGDKRLCEFRAWPPQRLWTKKQFAPSPWSKWFKPERTGYFLPSSQGEAPPPDLPDDIVNMKIVEGQWRSVPVPFEEVQNWKGTDSVTGETFYIRAASFQGRPTFFGKLTAAQFQAPEKPENKLGLEQSVWIVFAICLTATGVCLAWWNFRVGRGDRLGAARVTIYNFVLGLVTLMTLCRHSSRLDREYGVVFEMGIAQVLFSSATFYMWYMAVEPYIRRVWPQVLISSARLISGRLRDPLVGHDLLVGSLVGMIFATIKRADFFIALQTELYKPPYPTNPVWGTLAGLKEMVGTALRLHCSVAFGFTAWLLITLTLFTIMFKSRKTAMACFFILYTALLAMSRGEYRDIGSIELIGPILFSLLLLVLVVRWGALATLVGLTASTWAECFPLTWNSSNWYFGHGLFAGFLILAIAAYGFYTSACVRSSFDSAPEPGGT